MKVLILCGGIGTRLREETEFRPKPMVPIGTQPILWHIMMHYSYYGYRDFVLALGYKGEMIRQYFLHYRLMVHDFTIDMSANDAVTLHPCIAAAEDWKVTCVDTGERALKGARMRRVKHFLDEDNDDVFLMTYGDGVADVNLDALLRFHRAHGKLITVTGVIPTMRFGELKTRADGTVSFSEKKTAGPAMVNGGYYVINKKVLDLLSTEDSCDFEIGLLEELAEQRQVMMFRHEGFWHCMDNIRDMDALNEMWRSGKRPWAIWEKGSP
ncbi:MAG TPA: glucose-1-phosphate cytidylyltransferase [Candidatus Hydrogenedentes bacterium]|nr:glucose-1-phosphate cytidylyltransferase [Candidatus Hydrogenedentota bacterium]HOL75413.1 glucose-1-phosphate cytidylyltransferase [Candidatus Hydrogenedentota bacterium]HPO84922.1 glucose-1-phosphate cytidylyltransferase [Candidatus Hydrogenedentota bacterium]